MKHSFKPHNGAGDGHALQTVEPPPAHPKSEELPVPTARTATDGGKSAFTLYMREIGQVRLLTPAEEIELAARIKAGDAAARDRMIRANLRLVVKISQDYEGLGLPLLDLINEGNIGLMSAVERFDPAKGAKFSTYAALWIKQAIRHALCHQVKTIRLPMHIMERASRMRRTAFKLQEILGREPTDEEVAAELGVTARQVANLRVAWLRPASLDAPLGGDETERLVDVIRDENADSPYEQLEGKSVRKMLAQLVDRLPPREACVLRCRFGLDDGTEHSLEEVGRTLHLTRERIRQLQNLALCKLRRMIHNLEDIPLAA
jgi:RNA polymerase primary sigma factor